MIRCMPRPRRHPPPKGIHMAHAMLLPLLVIAAPSLYKRIAFDTNYTEHLLTQENNRFVLVTDVSVVSKQRNYYVVHKSVG